MSDQLEKLLAQEPMKKPAKAWRNWYLCERAFRSKQSGIAYLPGDVVPGFGKPWPSKEIAEQKAAEYMRSASHILGNGRATYIGAFPEGERP